MSARFSLLVICLTLLGSEQLFAVEAPCASVVFSGQACFSSAGEFTYNALGQRVRMVEKTNGAVTSNITYLWAGGQIAEERDSTGGTVQKRYFGDGMMVGATKYFFVTDHLGSIREVTDNAGNIVSRFDYDVYGNRTQVSGTFDPGQAFTGHWHHSSGLILTWFRAYDPVTGRWLKRDPIGERGGVNLYAYVRNSPITLMDPLGLIDWWGLLGDAAGAVESGLEFAMGVGDAVTFGYTTAYTRNVHAVAGNEAGVAAVDQAKNCSDSFGAGNFTGKVVGLAAGGAYLLPKISAAGAALLSAAVASPMGMAITNNILRIERGDFKVKGQWLSNSLHVHFNPLGQNAARELMRYHLPYQWRSWWGNFNGIINRWFK